MQIGDEKKVKDEDGERRTKRRQSRCDRNDEHTQLILPISLENAAGVDSG